MAETVVCIHRTDVKTIAVGDLETCRICGQELLCSEGQKPKVLKRGYIDGVMTEIYPPKQRPPEPPPEQPKSQRPPNWGEMTMQEKARWYDEHKEEILNAIREKGKTAARKEWGINTSTWHTLIPRLEGTPIRRKRKGHEPDSDVPARPRKLSPQAIHKYFKKHNQAILNDFKTLGEMATRRRWGISGSAWKRMIARWVEAGLIEESPVVQESISPAAKTDAQLPSLPPFERTLDPLVQVEWLKTYKDLKLAGKL